MNIANAIRDLATLCGLRRLVGIVALVGLVQACETPQRTQIDALATSYGGAAAAARVNGVVGTPGAEPPPQVVLGPATPARPPRTAATPGAYSLDFVDADIRDVVSQVLGTMLGINYVIDPSVRGTATLRTTRPLQRDELLTTLQSLLAGNGAALLSAGGVTRVVPQAVAGGAGNRVVPLRYVSAEELAKVMQPLAGANAKVTAETNLNALILSGDPAQIEALDELVRSFDVDALAGQSYALLPVTGGSARDFADALQEAFRGRSGASLAGLVRVSPLPRLGAVLVVGSQPRYIEQARRIYALVDQQRRATLRSWRIHYLQNSNAQDVAHTLQMAFTPNNVTATPRSQQGGTGRAGMLQQSAGRSGLNGQGTGGGGGLNSAGGGSSLGGSISATSQSTPGAGASGPGSTRLGASTASANSGQTTASINPLLGGLDPNGASTTDSTDTMRVLPDDQNNALLIFGTGQEADTVMAMLRKIDILPMQVRIDATIAEVTLNDQLKYGTQWFFKGGGLAGALGGTLTGVPASDISSAVSGFVFGSTNGTNAISALQSITTVNVLSSPQLLVVDNQPARLQVGSLVPYLNATSQSTISSNAPVVNSISYQPTGVIMDITPRVNSGGLVTLDITQEVSDVDTTSSKASGIDSPTFQQRIVSSRVVVQDGQTVGIAGLIRDNSARANFGIPWLKDIPVLGLLAGTQDNRRVRTELLVLITPRVVRDQREARDLTEDLREALPAAAMVPQQLQILRPSGSSDPGAPLRRRIEP